MATGTRAAFKTASASYPSQGNREIPITLDFTATGTLSDDLTPEMHQSEIETIQTVYIDNSLNPSPLTITPLDTQATITAQAFSQGIYPIISRGQFRYKATTAQGIKVQVVFSNTQKSFATWLVGAAIVSLANNVIALGVGNTTLVPAVAGQSVKLYRGMFEVDGAAILKFTDGAGGAVLYTANLQAFGSLNFPETQSAWLKTSNGNALVINSNAAVNLYGGFGYAQS